MLDSSVRAVKSGCLSQSLCLLLVFLNCTVGGILFLLHSLLSPILPCKGHIIPFSLPPLTRILYCIVSVLYPHTHNLGSLSTSTGTAFINMSSSCPGTYLICSCKYWSGDTVVPLMCFVLHIMGCLPVTHMLYENPM